MHTFVKSVVRSLMTGQIFRTNDESSKERKDIMKEKVILVLLFILNVCFAQDDPKVVRERLGFEGQVIVKLQKNTFLFGEPIRVDLEYTNFSDPGPKLDYTILKQRLRLYRALGGFFA